VKTADIFLYCLAEKAVVINESGSLKNKRNFL